MYDIVIVYALKHTVLELLVHIGLHHCGLLGHTFRVRASLVVRLLGWLFQGLDKTLILALALNVYRLLNIIEILQVFRRLPLLLQQAVCLTGRAAIDRLCLNVSMGCGIVLEQI